MSLAIRLTLSDTSSMSLSTPSTRVDTPPATNRILLGAGTAAALTALIHIVGGGIDVARPLVESPLAEEPRLVMFAVWHMASVALTLSATALLFAALRRHRQPAHYLAIFVGVMWLGFGLCFVSVGLTQPGGDLFKVLPQWILLIPTGVMALWGAWQDRLVDR